MTAQASAPTASVDPRRPRRAAHARPAEGQPAGRRDRAGEGARRPWLTPRSVRARIVCLLALPIVSLTSLWGIAAVDTISAAFGQSQLHTMDSSVAMPLDNAVGALQLERSAAAAYLAAPSADPTAFESRVSATRSAESALQTGIEQSAAAAANLGDSLSDQLTSATQAMNGLAALREAVLGRATTAATAYRAYSAAIDDAFTVQSTLAGISGAPSTAQASLALSEAREQLAVQDAVLSGAQAAGRLDANSYQQFVGALYAERAYLRQATTSLPDPTANASGARLAALQDALVAAGPGSAGPAAAAPGWASTSPAVLADLDMTARAAAIPASADPYGRLLTTGSGFGVLLGLFALVVSLLISVGIGRRLVTDLVGLRDYALDLAGRKLPETMARLRAGQLVEPGEQAPPLDPDAGELGQVADALAVASRAAMRAAIERAELVSGVSGVFLNLARRSQVLVHRQLALLDTMERRIEEPDHLEDLFRLDHLATRMRRHAEGLIILSGATPGRAWRNPVDLTDVVRAAAAEAEDYARVEVRRMPRARVLGPAVADLTHLLAELVENATSFSPPHTRVVVGGEPVGSGYAIEIEDRGLGMSPEALREANRRIGESSGDDLFDSDRLGLFVVSRLARRHDIRVSLCASAYGGITAVVLIPSTVMQPPGSGDRSPTAEHDLGMSGAMPHGPLTDPTRLEDPEHDGFADSASSNPVMQPARTGGAQTLDGIPKQHAPQAQDGAVPTDGEDGEADPSQDSPAAGIFTVPHANGHSATSEAARPHRFDVLTPPARTRGSADDRSFAPLGPDGLPHRVRQANLAPQLRADGSEPTEQRAARRRRPGGARPPRTPEENRATMSAFQRGFTRGRAEEPVDPPSPAPPPAAEADDAGPADHDHRGEGPR